MKKTLLFIILIFSIVITADVQDTAETLRSGDWQYQANNTGWVNIY